MNDIDLTQEEANELIAMEKHRVDNKEYLFPQTGGSLNIPLHSIDKRENFFLDIYRGRIDTLKVKYQNRTRQIVILLRLDLRGAPHRNPDGEEIPCPHLHIFRQGYGDKWAGAIPIESFPNITDNLETLNDFMRYCNISEPPVINGGIFHD